MKKYMLTAFALLYFVLAAPALATQPSAPPDGIKMENTRLTVLFNHSTHKDIQCAGCHHAVNNMEVYGKCADAGCHDGMFRKDTSFRNYYYVIHAKSKTNYSTCFACHAQAAAKFPDRKKELTACKQSKCHP